MPLAERVRGAIVFDDVKKNSLKEVKFAHNLTNNQIILKTLMISRFILKMIN